MSEIKSISNYNSTFFLLLYILHNSIFFHCCLMCVWFTVNSTLSIQFVVIGFWFQKDKLNIVLSIQIQIGNSNNIPLPKSLSNNCCNDNTLNMGLVRCYLWRRLGLIWTQINNKQPPPHSFIHVSSAFDYKHSREFTWCHQCCREGWCLPDGCCSVPLRCDNVDYVFYKTIQQIQLFISSGVEWVNSLYSD